MTATTTDGVITAVRTTDEDGFTVVTLLDHTGRPLLAWNEPGGTRTREWLAQLQASRRPTDLRLDDLVVTVQCGPEPTLAVYEPFVDGEPSLQSLFALALPLSVFQGTEDPPHDPPRS